jgi:Cytochrome c7 and related cytochrome c
LSLARACGIGSMLVLFACGGGAQVANPALAAGATAPSAVAGESPTSSASVPGPAAPGPLSPGVGATVLMKSPVASAMQAELKALALDPNDLPPIEKIDAKALRGVMKLIAKSLGAKCADCHAEGDFALPTPRKKVAAKMWDEFVVKLAFAADGSPLFCDSCHQGHTKELDRTDKKALAKWMDANFVGPIKRKDGKDHDCETCHVNMEMRFISRWAGAELSPL